MEWAIVILPLLGALLAVPVGAWLGDRAAEVLTSALVSLAAVFSWIAFFNIALATGGETAESSKLIWFESGALTAYWGVMIDPLTAVMLVVINSVSALVHIYSIGYMHEDPHRPRFFAYLSLFTFAMLMLVSADNFLQLFFGWEGVGLASYLLIGFWYKKKSANDAAMKAFIVNRVGDFGLALGIMAIFLVFGSVEYDIVFEQVPEMAGQTFNFLGHDFDILTTIGVLLFIGAMGKSAQLFLHTWLPDAMEGPTPVSALIHAATMVTAGVFLVSRASPIFEYAPGAMAMVAVVGASTAFFAATVGLLQDDIKRVIAYSTCSQLGYMFFAAGVGAYDAAMFHLFTHAFFKALLFLGAGAVIHGMHHEQDMKKMGGIYQLMPMTWIFMLVGTFAITGIGIPGTHIGTAGFVSKDAILETAYAAGAGGSAAALYAFALGTISVVFTSFYSWRLIFLTFHGKPRAPESVLKHAHDAPSVMSWPLIPLAIGALVAGSLFAHNFIGEGKGEFWKGSLAGIGAAHVEEAAPAEAAAHVEETVHTETAAPVEAAAAGGAHAAAGEHHPPGWVLWGPIVMMLTGFAAAAHQYWRDAPRQGLLRPGGLLYEFLRNKWYFDEIYDALIVKPILRLGRFLWKVGDGAIIDGWGPDGVSARVIAGARAMIRLQSGYVYHYAFAMLIGVALFTTIALIWGGGR